MIWALAEARRLRREAISMETTLASSPDDSRAEPGEGAEARNHADAQDGLVVDWQLSPGPSRHSSV